MSTGFLVLTFIFALISVAMVLIILVQRPSGGGLSGAFGGAGGGGSDTMFGGRTGDALTWGTVAAFALYLVVAIGLNVMDDAAVESKTAAAAGSAGAPITPTDPVTPAAPDGTRITPSSEAVKSMTPEQLEAIRKMQESLLSNTPGGSLPGVDVLKKQQEEDAAKKNATPPADGGSTVTPGSEAAKNMTPEQLEAIEKMRRELLGNQGGGSTPPQEPGTSGGGA